MIKQRKQARPTEAEARAIKIIAVTGGLIVTHRSGHTEYTTPTGVKINPKIAERIIKAGWLIGDRDSLFDCCPQRYRVRKL